MFNIAVFSLRRKSLTSIAPFSPPPPHPTYPLLSTADYKSRCSAGPFDDRTGASTMRFVGACENARVRVHVSARSSPLSMVAWYEYTVGPIRTHIWQGSGGGREGMARDESASLTGY